MDSNTLRQLVWKPEESAKLDFKIELYKIFEPKPTTQADIQIWSQTKEQQWAELIKDVIALANGNIGTSAQTGYLVLGADDKLKADDTPTLRDVGNVVPTRKEILEKVNSYCQPQLPDLQSEEIVVDGVKLFVIYIPPSPYLYRLSKQLKTPKKEYSPHTVLIRRGDGERIYEASPDEQRAIEQEKQVASLKPCREDTVKLFQEELKGIDAQVPQSILEALHWRITLCPITYNTELISSRLQCSKIVIKSMLYISDAKWSYPCTGDRPNKKGSNWIGVETPSDFYRHEYWRLYQSGQFINFSKTWEQNSNNIITDTEIIYTLTAAFRFAANLFHEEVYARGINITIELNNVKDYGLKLESDFNDLPSQYHKATENSYQNTWVIPSNSLSSIFDEQQALKAIVWFVECFWSDPFIPIEVFKNKQRELLSI